MADIEGYAECWGISVLHCPYCHGYEVKNLRTGILGNGDYACGDNSSRLRTVSYAVSTGTIAGIMINKEIIEEKF